MNYYLLDPEVAGGLGPRTEIDTTVHPPIVAKLHFELDAWLGDDLVQSFPCYLVSESLKLDLEIMAPSGVSFHFAEVTASGDFEVFAHGKELPKLVWMKVSGSSGCEDFGLTPEARLVVSERVLVAMKRFRINHCGVKQVNC